MRNRISNPSFRAMVEELQEHFRYLEAGDRDMAECKMASAEQQFLEAVQEALEELNRMRAR